MVPGTGFNAAVALPWLKALSANWATTVIDLPGQPGLSDPRRPRRARLAWYGRALDEILAAMDADGVVLVGNSLGAALGSLVGGVLHDLTGGYATVLAFSLCSISLASMPFWTVPALRNYR